MARALAVWVLVVLSSVGRGQATQQSTLNPADARALYPHCRPKASTPEPPVPDARFDALLSTKPAESAPVLIRSTLVRYPRSAMDSGICGTVVLQVLVKADGKVGGSRVVGSLDKAGGLDADAVKAVKDWRFKPGLVNGKAVATVITVWVEYLLDALSLGPFDAAGYLGQFASVCGYLRPAAAGKGDAGMRRFEFSADKKSLVVHIPESAKEVLDLATPINRSAVCVIGPIVKADGRPLMTVTHADRITMEPDVPPTGVANMNDPGLIRPKIRRQFDPEYTPEAMRHKIEGLVEMDAIVMTDGSVGSIRIIRSLDPVYGLDEEAVATARRWRFAPGTKDGRPTAVRIRIQMEFRLH